MSPDRVVAYCLGREPETPIGASPRDAGPPASDDDPLAALTSREREIADLVARGLKNREIAATLVLSRRTVEAHVQRVLIKLGFTSRSQVAALVVQSPAPAEASRADAGRPHRPPRQAHTPLSAHQGRTRDPNLGMSAGVAGAVEGQALAMSSDSVRGRPVARPGHDHHRRHDPGSEGRDVAQS